MSKNKNEELNGIYNTEDDENRKKAKKPKNRFGYSNPIDKQYNISTYRYPVHAETKDERKPINNLVQSEWNHDHVWTRKNFMQALKSPEKQAEFMAWNLMKLVYLRGKGSKKEHYLVQDTPDIMVDCIFIDHDNKHPKRDENGRIVREMVDGKNTWVQENLMLGTEGHLTFEKAEEILEKSGYNYILSTSASHDDKKQHKFHILIMTLRPIKDAATYKAYREKAKELFDGYIVDDASSSFANLKNAGNPNTIRVKVQLSPERRDMYLDPVEVKAIQTSKKPTWAKEKTGQSRKSSGSNIPSDGLNAYGKMLHSQYGMILDEGLSRVSGLKIRRDCGDKGPGVFNAPYSHGYNSRMIFDNLTKKNGTRYEFETIFDVNDFVIREDAGLIRNEILDSVSDEVFEWMYAIENNQFRHKHRYLITNEGLGKSSTIVKMGKLGLTFVYALHTKEAVRKKAKVLEEEGVSYRIVYDVVTILERNGFGHLEDDYAQYCKSVKEPSFKKFLNGRVGPDDQIKLLDDYHSNNALVQEDAVILMTSAKLKIMMMRGLGGIWTDKKPVVLDEFVDSEWKRYSTEEPTLDADVDAWMRTTWGGEKHFKDLYKVNSFFEELEPKDVLVLTTERALVDVYFRYSDYREMDKTRDLWTCDFENGFKFDGSELVNFDKKLIADNINYWLVSSTSIKGGLRQDMLEYFEKLGWTIICDGAKKSGVETKTHLGVKGDDSLKKSNTVVFGTMNHEDTVKEFIVNNKEYFKKKYGYDISGKILGEEGDAVIKMSESDDKVVKRMEEETQRILIQTQVSQSIGRNSGFRGNGGKTIVLLPVLNSNTPRRLARYIESNYISEKVKCVEFNRTSKEFEEIQDFYQAKK